MVILRGVNAHKSVALVGAKLVVNMGSHHPCTKLNTHNIRRV